MDRIEAAAKAIAEVVYPVLSWDGLPRDAKDYYMKLARAASAVLSDEGLRKTLDAAARLAENNYRPWAQSGGADECPHGINVGIGCRECDEKTVKAALSRQAQDEPSQSVNYVSAPHDAKTMRCQSCDSEQWPQCPSCGALLIEKPESTQEPPSQQEAEAGRLRGLCAAVYQFVGANMQKIGGCRRFLDALSNAANGEPFDTEHLLPYDSDEPICMTDVQPAPVQPSGTEDVVERMIEDDPDYCAYLCFSNGGIHIADSDTDKAFKVWRGRDVKRIVTAALAVALDVALAEPSSQEKYQMGVDFAEDASKRGIGRSGWDSYYHALGKMFANRRACLTQDGKGVVKNGGN